MISHLVSDGGCCTSESRGWYKRNQPGGGINRIGSVGSDKCRCAAIGRHLAVCGQRVFVWIWVAEAHRGHIELRFRVNRDRVVVENVDARLGDPIGSSGKDIVQRGWRQGA